MLKEVRFRFRHDGCWLQESTERYPGLMLVLSSVYARGEDVVANVTAHAPESETIDSAQRDWEADDRLETVRRLEDGPRGTRFHMMYRSKNSIFHHIVESTPIKIGEIRVADGTEHYSLLGTSEAIQDLLRILMGAGDLHVESIREPSDFADDDPEESPWSELTDKQLEAVVLAYLGGYYNWPRDRSATALSEDLGLSSSAFLDHLRHAEAKLLSQIMSEMERREPGRIQALRARRREATIAGGA